MNKKEIIEDFQVEYKKYTFSKSIKVTLKNDNLILVTMPYFCPYKTAREFLIKNFEKIKSFKDIENFKNTKGAKKYSPNFTTKFDTLKIIPSNELKTITKRNIVYFYYNKEDDFYSLKVQNELKSAHLKALRIEAGSYLTSRLDFLAKKYNFSYRKVFLKNQKTRFGSCSFCNNINLNINLLNYDFDIIDYVLIHELVHTKIKNHSKAFWLEVEKYCPNYKELRKKLKNGS